MSEDNRKADDGGSLYWLGMREYDMQCPYCGEHETTRIRAAGLFESLWRGWENVLACPHCLTNSEAHTVEVSRRANDERTEQ